MKHSNRKAETERNLNSQEREVCGKTGDTCPQLLPFRTFCKGEKRLCVDADITNNHMKWNDSVTSFIMVYQNLGWGESLPLSLHQGVEEMFSFLISWNGALVKPLCDIRKSKWKKPWQLEGLLLVCFQRSYALETNQRKAVLPEQKTQKPLMGQKSSGRDALVHFGDYIMCLPEKSEPNHPCREKTVEQMIAHWVNWNNQKKIPDLLMQVLTVYILQIGSHKKWGVF